MSALHVDWPDLDGGEVRFPGLAAARANVPQLGRGVLVVRGAAGRTGPESLRITVPAADLEFRVDAVIVASAAGLTVLTFPPLGGDVLAALWRDSTPPAPALHTHRDEAELGIAALAFRSEISGSFITAPDAAEPPHDAASAAQFPVPSNTKGG